jgi:hypothetical protein
MILSDKEELSGIEIKCEENELILVETAKNYPTGCYKLTVGVDL